MPKPNLSSMSVDALLKLREDINEALDRKASELRSQLFNAGRTRHSAWKPVEGPEGPAEISWFVW
jgi:hypothetical protein